MLRGVPPDAGATYTSIPQLMSPRPSRGYQNATDLPSGENTGLFSNVRAFVRSRSAPVATSSNFTWTESSRPLCGATTCANAIVFPSGDQLNDDGALLGGRAN